MQTLALPHSVHWQENAVGVVGQMYLLFDPCCPKHLPHSPMEALRSHVEGVEPVDASSEVCIVSAVCVANTNA